MEKIYQSFDELLKQNQTVFKLIEKSTHLGLYQAVWDARQAEVDDLKLKLQGSQKNATDFKNQLQVQVKKNQEILPHAKLESSKEIQKLNNELTAALEKISELEALSIVQAEELDKSSAYVQNLREYAEKSSIFAEQAQLQALHSERECIEEKERVLALSIKEENYVKEIQELKTSLANVTSDYQNSFAKCAELTAESKELKKELDKMNLDYLKELSKCEKLDAELVHFRGHVEKCEYDMGLLEEKNQTLLTQISEITNYTTALRNDYEFCIANLKKSEKNVDKISIYAEDLKSSLQKEHEQNRSLRSDLAKVEEFLKDYKEEISKLRQEKIKLGSILQNIQSTINPGMRAKVIAPDA